VVVEAVDGATTGGYRLRMDGVPGGFVPPGETCEDAIDIQHEGLSQFDVYTCQYSSDYVIPSGLDCLDWWPVTRQDVVYKIHLNPGQLFSVNVSGSHDKLIYLVTDCSDMYNTCVAGSQQTGSADESINYVAETDSWYYLIINADSGCGPLTVTIDSPVATIPRSWGAAKDLYR
jgi:hypothetical protein